MSYFLKIPKQFPLNDEVINAFATANPDLRIKKSKDNELQIDEGTYSFSDFEHVSFSFPKSLNFSYKELSAIIDENENLRIETEANGDIKIRGGFSAAIGIYSAKISAELYFWAFESKLGNVFGGNVVFELPDVITANGLVCKMADTSFIAFDKSPERIQNNWGLSYIPVAPTFCIEIVSAPKGLADALHKAEHFWKLYGCELTIVVCPFSLKIYSFEKGVDTATEQSIFEPFSHALLPNYTADFSSRLDLVNPEAKK